LDGWSEYFDFSKWLKAFEYVGIHPIFMWIGSVMNMKNFPGITSKPGYPETYLWNERLKGLHAESSPPCDPHCQRCGLCGDESGIQVIKARRGSRKQLVN